MGKYKLEVFDHPYKQWKWSQIDLFLCGYQEVRWDISLQIWQVGHFGCDYVLSALWHCAWVVWYWQTFVSSGNVSAPSALKKIVLEMVLDMRRNFRISEAEARASPFEFEATLGSVASPCLKRKGGAESAAPILPENPCKREVSPSVSDVIHLQPEEPAISSC